MLQIDSFQGKFFVLHHFANIQSLTINHINMNNFYAEKLPLIAGPLTRLIKKIDI